MDNQNNVYNTPYTPRQQLQREVPKAPSGAKGLGLAGMITGIVAVASVTLADIPILSIICAVASLPFSIIGLIKGITARKFNAFALVGLICSAVAISVVILMAITSLIFGSSSLFPPNAQIDPDLVPMMFIK